MPKASDKKPRALSLVSLSLSFSFLPPFSLSLSLSLYVCHRRAPFAARAAFAPRTPTASTLVVSPPLPASVKNAAKQRGGITKRRCSIFIPPSFDDDKVRRKEGESFCRNGKGGEGENETRGELQPILDSRFYDLPVRSTKMLRSLRESGIHKRTLSRGLEVLTHALDIL